MKIKDFSDAMIKVASINDDRIKAWDDFRKGMELYDKIRRILNIRQSLIGSFGMNLPKAITRRKIVH